MRHQNVVIGAAALLLAVMVTAAPPGDSTKHHDENTSPISEIGSDEEVRQLLDLKGLTAQRDLGNLKRNVHASPSSSSSLTQVQDSAASLADNVNEDESKISPIEDTKEKDGSSSGKSESGPSTLRSEQEPQESKPVEDRIPLKRQQQVLSNNPHVHYTPLDLALYVYKTGDEEGVTLAIQELIAEGLMTAEEALNYLREIRENLRYLNQKDEQQDLLVEDDEINGNGLKSLMKKNSLPLPLTEMSLADPDTMLAPEVDYDNILERLRGQDYVTTEYSLEEVIYQLAKILFKQAMHREGDIGSEKALQEVAALLEKEAARGAITPEVEKKVLDVMVNSMVDSISENEIPSGPGPMIGGSNLKLANQSPFTKGNSPLIGGSSFKPGTDLFQLTKSTTKREAPKEEAKKATEEKN